MPDYRRMYDDKENLYAYDLPQGKDVVVCIDRCTAGELMGDKGRKSKKPMLSFKGETKKLALNKTNGKTIAKLYGKETDDWAGKWITIYATTTEFGGETVDCIRVRPQVPQSRAAGKNGNGNAGRGAPAKGQDLTDQIADKMAESSGGGFVSDLASKPESTPESGDAAE